jgi:hypothetical protein
LLRHATHAWVVVSQTSRFAAQSASLQHPSGHSPHACVDGSHQGFAPTVHCESDEHVQVWLAGSHAPLPVQPASEQQA